MCIFNLLVIIIITSGVIVFSDLVLRQAGVTAPPHAFPIAWIVLVVALVLLTILSVRSAAPAAQGIRGGEKRITL